MMAAPKNNKNAVKAVHRKPVLLTLAPATLELLAPFTGNRQRSRVIDEAVRVYLLNHQAQEAQGEKEN